MATRRSSSENTAAADKGQCSFYERVSNAVCMAMPSNGVSEMFMLAGYKQRPHSSHYPTVCLYGLYPTIKEAQVRQLALCNSASEGDALGPNSVAYGRGYVTWIRLVPWGDIEGTPAY